MKRIVILMGLFMILLGSVCFAEEVPVTTQAVNQEKPFDVVGLYKQAQEVSEMYSDCVYLYQSSGLTYERFDQMFIRATLAKNKFLTKNGKNVPLEIYVALEKVDKTFADARDLWQFAVNTRYLEKSKYTDGLMVKYPKLKDIHRQGLFGVYDVNEIAPIVGQ